VRVIYMGKDKPSVIRGLGFLVDADIDVTAVVGPEPGGDADTSLTAAAAVLGIPVRTEDELYRQIDSGGLDVDLVLSFLYWKRIRRPLIDAPTLGCVNFHPAPLPDFRGVNGYSIAIWEGLGSWGVSAHFVDERFDTGDLIEVRRFPIDAATETALTLERKSQAALLELFEDLMTSAGRGEPLPRTPQGEGRYVSREDFERLRRIGPDDTRDDVLRKIRAFWFPPHGGAYVDLHGSEFTLMDDRLLHEIADLYGTATDTHGRRDPR
jgi:methionyl-tRNA formyltransferase